MARAKRVALVAITANVNGIRAAARRGGLEWLAGAKADVICLQEVRATHEQVHEQLAESGLAGMHVSHSASESLGRNGVAVLTREQPVAVREGVGDPEFARQGRWIEVDLETVLGPITVVSAYVHTGEAQTPKQDEKFRFLDAMDRRLAALRRRASRQKGHVLVTGDFNVAHAEVDIKNWKGNLKKAGFLPEERAFLDEWLACPVASPAPGATWAGLSAARVPAPIHGGPGAVAASTPTAGGASTTRSRRLSSPPAHVRRSWAKRPPTPSAGATMRRSRSRSPEHPVSSVW